MTPELRVDPSKLGVAVFLYSEVAFFLTLIIGYVFFHLTRTEGPSAAQSLHPLTAGIYTACLLGSSGTFMIGERAMRRGNYRGLSAWLAITVALGAIFVLGQGREYLGLYEQDVTLSRNLFGTTFFTLTGFHGLHVIMGVVALGILLALSVRGEIRDTRTAASVEAVGLYWHFVDLVWVVIFAIIYLWSTR